MRRLGRWTFLATAALLAGCFAELDWRESRSPEGGYAVLLPARPDLATQRVRIGSVELKLHMRSAEAKGMAFGVAHADIPPEADRAQLLEQARDALKRNVDGVVTTQRAVAVPGAAGLEFQIAGRSGETPMRIAGRVLIGEKRFYQIVFVGQEARTAEVDLPFYLESFRLLN